MLPEPYATTRTWLKTFLTGPVTTQFNPDLEFPQVSIDVANWRSRAQNDGLPSPAFHTLDIGITVYGHGGERPDFQTPYTVIQAVTERLYDLTYYDDAIIFESSTGLRTSRAVHPELNCAMYTLTAALRTRII